MAKEHSRLPGFKTERAAFQAGFEAGSRFAFQVASENGWDGIVCDEEGVYDLKTENGDCRYSVGYDPDPGHIRCADTDCRASHDNLKDADGGVWFVADWRMGTRSPFTTLEEAEEALAELTHDEAA